MLETKTIHVFGASNMRQIIPELEKHGYPVVDHTIPGWMPTPANISALSDSLSKLDKDSIVITDLLGNYAYRYSQMDGTLALPFKSDGKYHFEGNVHMLTMTNLKLVIENLKPALGKCNCHLIFSPPLPRHLHSRCCASLDHCTNVDTEKHAETMLGELNGIRTACIANLELVGIKNFKKTFLKILNDQENPQENADWAVLLPTIVQALNRKVISTLGVSREQIH